MSCPGTSQAKAFAPTIVMSNPAPFSPGAAPAAAAQKVRLNGYYMFFGVLWIGLPMPVRLWRALPAWARGLISMPFRLVRWVLRWVSALIALAIATVALPVRALLGRTRMPRLVADYRARLARINAEYNGCGCILRAKMAWQWLKIRARSFRGPIRFDNGHRQAVVPQARYRPRRLDPTSAAHAETPAPPA